jgi:hypothetical protein
MTREEQVILEVAELLLYISVQVPRALRIS